MKTYAMLILAVTFIVSGCQTAPKNSNPAAVSDITVIFKDADKYTDASDSRNGATSQYYLDEISKTLETAAAQQLTVGQKLSVTFIDIDLAGDIMPGQLSDIRIIKPIYMPRMTLTFKLTNAQGAAITEGERTLSDMNFQQNIPISLQSEPLSYDMALIKNWVQKEF